MAKIYWRPPGSDSAYGDSGVTLDYMDSMDELQVAYMESQGHSVYIGSRTNTDLGERESAKISPRKN